MSRWNTNPQEVRGPFSGCWEWAGHTQSFGHGAVTVGGTRQLVHRAAYTALVGDIPEGLCVLHHCDNPPCFNPAHLFLGTRTDNAEDKTKKGRAKVKLSQKDVDIIRQEHKPGRNGNTVSQAKRFGISRNTLTEITRGEIWSRSFKDTA